jgi:hypothetical protein
MRTDAHLYQIFRRFPELVFLLAGLPSPGPCTMKSVAIKTIARTMDGFIEAVNPSADLHLVEFQMQPDLFIFHRGVIEQTYLQMELYPRNAHMIIMFGSRSLDIHAGKFTEPLRGLLTVVYLDEALQELAKTQPDHFLISLFRPLVEPEKIVVEKHAPMDYEMLKHVQLGATGPAGLEAIFLDWLMQLFKTKTRTQIAKMIAELTPIENTVAGRELIELGEERGMERGMGQLLLQQMEERFGEISSEAKQGVSALVAEDLPALGRALMHFPDLTALESWLRLRLGR